ncbi:MAG: polymer-forming cytoskeletal protein [Bacillota bacterium]|jgi:cytoskeletal protein CcmA (bactofilin family)|nr:polymer-forming cytoskeletal protein [Bacillota bacterium]
MSDYENKDKVIQKGSELGESFSDLMKKVVEKQLEEENAQADAQDAQEEKDEVEEAVTFASEKKGSETVVKSDAVIAKTVEIPVFEWKEEPKPVVENYQPVSEVGVISPLTTINGTVSSKGHIRVEGSIIGDIFAYGDIKVTGKVAGDIEGGNIELGNCIVEGDVKARGDVNIGKDSTLSGDMIGQLITIDGKIKGNIEAVKGAHMSGTSTVKGSITAPTLSMSAGAELQGKVSVSKEDAE